MVVNTPESTGNIFTDSANSGKYSFNIDYYENNGAAGTGTGGGGSGSQSLQTINYSTPGNGGSGLAYFYIGFKAPTTP